MRTTIDINDAILRELREQARESNCSLKELVHELLSLGISQRAKGSQERRFEVKTHDLGIKPGFRGVSLNQIYDQLEEKHRRGYERFPSVQEEFGDWGKGSRLSVLPGWRK